MNDSSASGAADRWSGGSMMCVFLLLASLAAAGEPPPAAAPDGAGSRTLGPVLESLLESPPHADAPPLVRVYLDRGVAVAYLTGHVTWSYTYSGVRIHLQADRLVIEAEMRREEEAPAAAKAAAPAALRHIRSFEFFAEGNVRVDIPARKSYFEADSFFYKHDTGRGVARNVRLRTTYTAARGVARVFQASQWRPDPTHANPDERTFFNAPLNIRAELLRMKGFEWFGGTGIEISTCEFAVPHYSLHAESVSLHPSDEHAGGAIRGKEKADAGSAGGSGEGLLDRDFTIEPKGTHVKIAGHRIVPLPVSRWDTRWQTHVPVRSVEAGSSSKFGISGGADWNVNYLWNQLIGDSLGPVSAAVRKVRLGFETNYMEKRGFSYGPNALYGLRPDSWAPWQMQLNAWTYYGEAQYFAIDDHGDEDRSTGLPPPVEDRYWGHVWHQQSIPYLGLFNVEYSKLSDSAFLGEYFEAIDKDGKQQENLVYWRRNILDNLAATGLAQARLNDFQSQVERLPEGKLFLLQQPLFGSGLYTDVKMQGAYLRPRPNDALGIPERELSRFDVLNEWSYPIGYAPYFQTRPFFLMRYSAYSEGLDPAAGSEDRATFGAGITVSQEWSRIFHFAPDSFFRSFLKIRELKHNIVPEVTYVNVFSNDLSPDRILSVDETDSVDLQESLTLSLRNEFFAREVLGVKPRRVRSRFGKRDAGLQTVRYKTRSLLNSNVRFVLFPQPHRDNDGDTSSLLIFDNTAGLTSRLYLRGWFELNPNKDFRGERMDASLGYELIRKSLWVTVGDRFTRRRTNTLYSMVNWNMTKKWSVDAYYAHDFETGKNVQYSFGLNRLFHRFVLSLEFAVDVGENNNKSVYLGFAPVELWHPPQGRGLRRY